MIDWDITLKIWAVVGPLLAAGVSAIWSRRNQIEDRNHDASQQRVAREHALEDRKLEFQRATINAKKDELRAALAQFVAAANDFIGLCQSNNGAGSLETQRLEREASARMNANYQIVNLMGTHDIVKLARKVLNMATDFPTEVMHLPAEQHREHRDEYFQAKKELASKARELLGIESTA